MMFLTCPARLDLEGAVRCGLPAEISCRFTMRSADGPLQSAMIRCPVGHSFSWPIESLTRYGTRGRDPGTTGTGSRARGRKARRPNTAPAYYLGHHARLWITVMRPGYGER